jgi:AraC-like DNA-binding protein
MRPAERALREENATVSALARSLGYTSKSAFSNAFKRVTGNAPKHYRSAFRGTHHLGKQTTRMVDDSSGQFSPIYYLCRYG